MSSISNQLSHDRSRLGRIAGRVPGPLAGLLVITLVLGITWALLVPPWQAPDTVSHYAYAESLAQRFALPSGKHRPETSSDELEAEQYAFSSNESIYPSFVSPGGWQRSEYLAYLAEERSHPSRSNGGGSSTADSNPPLYYLYADLAYWVFSGGTTFDRLYAMQLWGVVLLLITVTAAWLLAGEVFGRRRTLQLVVAASTGLLPMVTFLSTSVNPDAMLFPLWGLVLWLGARVINRAAPRRDAVAMCALTATAILTQGRSYALVPPVLLALLLGWLLRPRGERGSVVRELGTPLLALGVPVLAWAGLAHALHRPVTNGAPTGGTAFNLRQFLSYLWQFYLPKLPWMTTLRESAGLPVFDVFVHPAWGEFGWLSVPLPNILYTILSVLSGMVILPALALLTRLRGARRLALAAFFATTVLSLLLLLQLTDYLELIASGLPLLQGRYLLPAAGIFGLAIALVASRLPRRIGAAACGAVFAGLLILQVICLATVAQVYYT